MTKSELIARIGMPSGGAVRISLGLATNDADVDRFLSFDADSGVVDCEPGVTFLDLLEHFLPRGYFPPVTPGTGSSRAP